MSLEFLEFRGDRRENIYEDDEDLLIFLGILGNVVTGYNWLCHSYSGVWGSGLTYAITSLLKELKLIAIPKILS